MDDFVPRGPSTCTVDTGSDLLVRFLFLGVGGARIVMLTSSGRESVAPPTREAHGVEVENGRTLGVQMKAGRRKAGRHPTGEGCVVSCRRYRAPLGDSMAVVYEDAFDPRRGSWQLSDDSSSLS